MKCQNCGYVDAAQARAEERVEGLTLDSDRLAWCKESAPWHDPVRELELFKIQFRRSDYKLSAGRGGYVRNAWAAFQYHMLQAVKFSKPRSAQPVKVKRPEPEHKEL